jgi:threonine dehydrogenase-like Zn-dependent dehydrogenase
VSAPQIKEPTDAIVRLTSSAICGADLRFVRGAVSADHPRSQREHRRGWVLLLGEDPIYTIPDDEPAVAGRSSALRAR